jgi:hypothetical protein
VAAPALADVGNQFAVVAELVGRLSAVVVYADAGLVGVAHVRAVV